MLEQCRFMGLNRAFHVHFCVPSREEDALRKSRYLSKFCLGCHRVAAINEQFSPGVDTYRAWRPQHKAFGTKIGQLVAGFGTISIDLR